MNDNQNHISICICTYKRAEFLSRLLEHVRDQETDGLFSYSIVVADNDALESGRAVVEAFAASCKLVVTYCVEPRQNIALTRNKALENATGNFIAFIDDDEFPPKRWLLTLFEACKKYGSDGVLGPVKPHFDEAPPKWIVAGKFYERSTYPTGMVIDGPQGRTGNVLLRRTLFTDAQVFNPKHKTGEDQEFFGRMIEAGHVFVWCAEAMVYETVPPMRWRRGFILKRTLLRGSLSPLDRDFGIRQIVTSIVAVPVYAIALPFTLLLGHHRLMSCLEKFFYHVGRLLALVGIKPIDVPYVTE